LIENRTIYNDYLYSFKRSDYTEFVDRRIFEKPPELRILRIT
jgi:hypothetical protein